MTQKSVFKRLDFLSNGVQLMIDGYKHKQSNIGAAFTILLAFFSIYISIYFGKEIFERKKVNYYISSLAEDTSPKHVYSVKDFYIIFGFINVNDQIVSGMSDVISVNVSNYNYISSADQSSFWKINRTSYELGPCEKETTERIIKKLQTDTLTCIKQGANVTLGGLYNENEVNFLRLEIKLCRNDTHNSACLPVEKQLSVLQENPIYLALGLKNSVIYPDNIYNPIQDSFQSPFYSIDATLSKIVKITYTNLIVRTDYGWFFENKLDSVGLALSEIETDLFTRSDSNDYFLDLAIYSNNLFTVHNRSYLKIQELIANLGAVIKLVYFAGNLLIGKVSSKLVHIDIMNQIFELYDLNLYKRSSKTIKQPELLRNVEIHKNIQHLIYSDTSKRSLKKEDSIEKNDEVKAYNSWNGGIASTMRKIPDTNKILGAAQDIHPFSPHIKKQSEVSFNIGEIEMETSSCVNVKHKSTFYMSDILIILSFLIPCKLKAMGTLGLKNSYYARCLTETEKYFDFEYIVKKLREIEYIKYLQFNEVQLHCFDYFKKIEMEPFPEDDEPDSAESKQRRSSSFTNAFRSSKVMQSKKVEMGKRIDSFFSVKSPPTEVDLKIQGLVDRRKISNFS